MGWWLQVIGIALGLVGGVATLVGFIISPEQTIITTIRKFFSETQSIKVLPPSLGGIDHLNLDNAARLKLHAPYSLESVTLILDVVPTSVTPKSTPGITVEGAQVYDHTSGTQYVFNKTQNKRHEITVSGRTFVVTLLHVKALDVPDVSRAIEFVFGITEK